MSKEKKEYTGVLHIYSSFNNTIVHVTDLSGSTISRYSGGMVTKQDRLKANPTTGMFLAKKIGEEIKELGITSLYIKMKAKTGAPSIGPGANMVVKTLSKDGFKILSISDLTKVPRGGPKKKGGRRGRRV
ncbi:MAG: 30S ribosomal protein S11 [Candidatus Pacearchaeota archaeon]